MSRNNNKQNFKLPQSINLTGDAALDLLKQGNERFIKGETGRRDIGPNKRHEVAAKRQPFAIILGCSDSRVPPEFIFDQGIGDLFVVRVAGNVVDDVALGSIEYAVTYMGVSLLVVLGHSDCLAVKTTFDGDDATPCIRAIASKIKPAVDIAKSRYTDPAAIVEDAVVENVKAVIREIEQGSRVIRGQIEHDTFTIVGAKYDLESGSAEFLVPATVGG
ncbi:MAG TPA: carbonic anhydrase [Candidatus Aquicultor sp.]|jgi:carbonic anhydrase